MRHEEYKIELFVFPDGTSVEMIVFDRPIPAGRPSGTTTVPQAPRPPAPKAVPGPCCAPPPPVRERSAEHTCAETKHTCPECRSDLVYPVDWERSSDSTWTLHLRCPECETRCDVTLGRAAIEQFNRELNRSAQAMAREADRLSRHNFEEEIVQIVAALERDLIQPMDF